MQEKHLYEYAVIRILPRVEREEFMNVGVILFCKMSKFLKIKYVIDEAKLAVFWPDIDTSLLNDNLLAWQKICEGEKTGGTIGQFDMAARFRWITATRSTIIQTSKVHPGWTVDAETTLACLFNELVL